MKFKHFLGFIAGVTAALVIGSVSFSGCGEIAPDDKTQTSDKIQPTESALGWVGSDVLEGDYTCNDSGEVWHIYQPASQTFTRPGQWNGFVPNYYTITLNSNGLPYTPDPWQRNLVTLNCPPMTVPTYPIGPCGSNNAICSTSPVNCGVFYKYHGSSAWVYAGIVNASIMQYRPDWSYRGNYLLSTGQANTWINGGDGYPVRAGCNGIAGQIWFSFGK